MNRPQGGLPPRAPPDPRQIAEENIWLPEVHQALREAVCRLPERLRQVIIAAYGLDGEPPRTLIDIGEQLGVSREMARYWRNDGLLLLRLPAFSGRLRHLYEQDSRAAYARTRALNRAWLQQKRGSRGKRRKRR
jgi:DNA-directed RNA polymerase sigma subunit (sigma70/sigma32)